MKKPLMRTWMRLRRLFNTAWLSAPWGSAFAFPNAATVRYFAITVHSILAAHLAPATTIKATRTLELMWRRIRLVGHATNIQVISVSVHFGHGRSVTILTDGAGFWLRCRKRL